MLNVILSGVAEGWRVADEIVKAGFPVIIPGLSKRLPTRESVVTKPLMRMLVKMAKAWSESCNPYFRDRNVRNLPFSCCLCMQAYGFRKRRS